MTNQIGIPRTRILADSAFSSGWQCMHAKDKSSAFAPFLADSGGKEQDDGFLGYAMGPTIYLSDNKWLSLIALTGKAVFVRTENDNIRLFRLSVSGR